MTPAPGYTIHPLELGPMANIVYVIVDHHSQRCAIVDPAWEVPAILNKVQELGVTITDILLTHSHNDHINGVDALLQKSDAQLHLLKAEAQFWGKELIKPRLYHGGDVITLGRTPIQILHTPGHTPGSACYQLGQDLIAGDTLFVYGCGRCDLRGGDPHIMFNTLRRLAQELPADTIIRPGHDYSVTPTSTLAEEIRGNPFLHFDDEQQFVEYRMHIHDKTRQEPYHPVLRPQKSS